MHPRFCYYPCMVKPTDQMAAIEKTVVCFSFLEVGQAVPCRVTQENIMPSPKAEGTRGA